MLGPRWFSEFNLYIYVKKKTVFLLFKNCPFKLDISDYCIVLISGAASFKLSIT